MNAPPSRFHVYELVRSPVIALDPFDRSTVIYCNQRFAQILCCAPDAIIGRRLEEIADCKRPHYSSSKKFAEGEKPVGRRMNGGLLVGAYAQAGRRKGKKVMLNITHIEKVRDAGGFFWLSYCRKATWVEARINGLRVGSKVDKVWKPVAKFCLSGYWRPAISLASAAAPLWLPYLAKENPDIIRLIRSLLQHFSADS